MIAPVMSAPLGARGIAEATPIGSHDLLIGAHARSLGLTVVTRNLREFERIPGLKVEDWAGA